MDTLESTKGVMVEFVNPKYTDDTRTTFKKPTRVECMMQDYAKVLPSTAKVGYCTNDTWLGYAPVKNSISEGVAKLRSGCDAMSAATAEAATYGAHCEMWRRLGCEVDQPVERQFGGIPVKLGPILSISPHFAVTRKELALKLPQPSQVKITLRGALVILGDADVFIESLCLDGALVVDTRCLGKGVQVVIRDVVIENKGWEFVGLQEGEEEDEVLRMRGYRLVKHDTETINFKHAQEGDPIVISSVSVSPVYLCVTSLCSLPLPLSLFLLSSQVSGEVVLEQTPNLGFAARFYACLPFISDCVPYLPESSGV